MCEVLWVKLVSNTHWIHFSNPNSMSTLLGLSYVLVRVSLSIEQGQRITKNTKKKKNH